MGHYLCLAGVMRLSGRSAIVPGDDFEYDFTPGQEVALINAGTLKRLDTPRPAPVDVPPVPATPAAATFIESDEAEQAE